MLKFNTNDNEILLNNVCLEYHVVESDVVNVLMFEISFQKDFLEYFMNKIDLDVKDYELKCVGRSITENIKTNDLDYDEYYGENDLVVIYTNLVSGRDCAILIEVKIDAQKMGQQPERYIARCKKYCMSEFKGNAEHNFEYCNNVIVATEAYYADTKNEANKYEKHVFLKEIIQEYYDKKKDLSAIDQYNRLVLEKAEKKIELPDPKKHKLVLGFREYIGYLKREYFELYDLLVTESLNSRKENNVAFLFDKKYGHCCWEIGLHFSTGKYFIRFDNVESPVLKQEIVTILEKACAAAEKTNVEIKTCSKTVMATIYSNAKFKYQDIYKINGVKVDPSKLTYDELLDLDVMLKEDKISLIEQTVNILNEIYDIVAKLDIEYLINIYEKFGVKVNHRNN